MLQLQQLVLMVTNNLLQMFLKLPKLKALNSKEVLHCPILKVWEIIIVNLAQEVIRMVEWVEPVELEECLK